MDMQAVYSSDVRNFGRRRNILLRRNFNFDPPLHMIFFELIISTYL